MSEPTDDVTATAAEPGPLAHEQEARAAALRVAREVSADRGFATSKPPYALDLIVLAAYIVDGMPHRDSGGGDE